MGSLTEGKGQQDAVLALSYLRNAGLHAELVVVGEGEPSYLRYLETLVESNALRKYVVLQGR